MAKHGNSETARAKSTVSYHRAAAWRVAFAGCLTAIILSATCWAVSEGDNVNVVPFGQLAKWDAQGKDYVVIWEDPRDIFGVAVRFADAKDLPNPKTIRLEYWQSSWPRNRIPRDSPTGW